MNAVRHVLMIYREMIPSVRLCGHCQFEDLAARGVVEYRAVTVMRLHASDFQWADVVLLGRLDSWYERKLATLARSAGKTLVYLIDDDLLNIPPEVSSASYYSQPEIQDNIRAMIEMSDALISPSPLLLEKYAVGGTRGIRIEEPALDPAPYAPHDPDAPVKIGFAGSIDRKGDVEAILGGTLTRIKADYGDSVAFEFFGAVPAFAEALGARRIPYCDSYAEYRRRLNEAAWDIGLAPMPDTPFHACKHYNKFCEYAAAGIAGVYSAVQPYTRIRAFGDCGILCENTPEAWEAALRRLLDDREAREAMRRAVSECAAQKLGVTPVADALWRDVAALPIQPGGAVRPVAGTLFFYKGWNLVKRLQSKFRGEGLRGCVKAVWKRIRRVGR